MIVWLNGTFGAGKTTTAAELVDRIPDARIFDAEKVGGMLDHVLGRVGNFQDHQPWRGIVVDSAARILDYVGGTLVIPQTVLNEQYWKEISEGLTAAGVPVHHYVLHTNRATLTSRIEGDTSLEAPYARQWRLDHLDAYESAYPWLEREATIIDTTQIAADAVAEQIAGDSVAPVG